MSNLAERYANLFAIGIREERRKQDAKWGEQRHSGHAWLGILMEEVGEVAAAINEERLSDVADELVQVAAVCCAMWQQNNRVGIPPAFGECKQTPAQAKEAPHA